MMKKLELTPRDILEFSTLSNTMYEFVMKQKLIKAGFDLGKEFKVWEDPSTKNTVYIQREEYNVKRK
jgi:aspartyl aminopeptidase